MRECELLIWGKVKTHTEEKKRREQERTAVLGERWWWVLLGRDRVAEEANFNWHRGKRLR